MSSNEFPAEHVNMSDDPSAPGAGHRSGAVLAAAYGYGFGEQAVRNLANDRSLIPYNALVADVGAGESTLGKEVCGYRRDVRWLNVDTMYTDYPEVLDRLSRGKQPNLEYVPGNILHLPPSIKPGSFHTVFSFYMLPHIINGGGSEAGEQAAINMLSLLRPEDGVFMGGPRTTGLFPGMRIKSGIRISAPPTPAELSQKATLLTTASTYSARTLRRSKAKRQYESSSARRQSFIKPVHN